ncbi:hypothetical protein TOPH_08160 [Tolypocladium ophioglossoides CBS 100239]|uniref:Nucleoside phosphorylase domain-containing protein n=1 Tax=Tolypocladium ophioglossoides (strain CBS 100239) TaxID=1163406 RepID=A0A0L0N089_TOLOC|nr:hypothetical protein TOPH_08160 [Tolypocladium ophioglossoides CBS 100239]
MSARRPFRREDFDIAIICALPLEYDAVSYIFDEFWDEDGDHGLRLALLVGVCGAVPHSRDGEALLGDVVISKTIIQYDFSRRYPGKFIRKSTIEDNLGRPNRDIRNLAVIFETDRGLD